MGMEDTLNGLVDEAYAAAFDDARWQPWSVRLIEALGGSGGAFHVLDSRGRPVHASIELARPTAIENYFDSGMHQLDPQLAFVRTLNGSCVYEESDHLDCDDPATAEYIAWMAGNVGWRFHLTGIIDLGNGAAQAGISIHRHVDRGPTPAEERRRLDGIFPEIARAMQLGFVHAAKLNDAFWEGLASGRTEPALLVGEGGRVLRANEGMEALLAQADGLDITAGKLHAAAACDDARLAALIGRSTAPIAARGGAARISRRSGRVAYIVTAYPLPARTRMLAPAEAVALVTVVDPVARPDCGIEPWRQAFGLTRREGELAVLLVAGHSIASAAAMLAIAEPTARLHLRHLFAKTQTSRQAELIRLLARLR